MNLSHLEKTNKSQSISCRDETGSQPKSSLTLRSSGFFSLHRGEEELHKRAGLRSECRSMSPSRLSFSQMTNTLIKSGPSPLLTVSLHISMSPFGGTDKHKGAERAAPRHLCHPDSRQTARPDIRMLLGVTLAAVGHSGACGAFKVDPCSARHQSQGRRPSLDTSSGR